MASVISFFVLLLITYSYSVPIGPPVGSPTTPYQYTTGQTVVENVNSVNMKLMPDNESTVVPTIPELKVTTDYVTVSSPVYEQSSYPSSTITSKKRSDGQDSESKESESQEKRGVTTFSTTTIKPVMKRSDNKDSESKESESQEKRGVTTFSTTTIKPVMKRGDNKDSESQESESQEKRADAKDYPESKETQKKRSDNKDSESKESESQEKRGVTTFSTTTIKPVMKRNDDKDSESKESESQEKRGMLAPSFPSSTVSNFLFTTLESSTEFNRRAIQPIQSEVVPESTTVFGETTTVEPSSSFDSFGKFTGLLPTKTPQLTKTISIVPGKITETKVFTDVPNNPSTTIMQPIQQEQLSQGQGEPVSQKRESGY